MYLLWSVQKRPLYFLIEDISRTRLVKFFKDLNIVFSQTRFWTRKHFREVFQSKIIFITSNFIIKWYFSLLAPISHIRICSICICGLMDNVLQLVCGHVFHDDFQKDWAENRIWKRIHSKLDLAPDALFNKSLYTNTSSNPVCMTEIQVLKNDF